MADGEALPARARTVTLAPLGGDGRTKLTATARAFAAQPAVARSLPLLGLLGVLGLAAALWMTLSAAPARPLLAGLPEADKAAVAEALDSAGVPYEINRDTGAITVGDDDYHRARMLLAAQGLPKSAPDGDALLGQVPLGASRAVEGERLRAAREADLARSIEGIDAVETARVHLAAEQASAFVRDQAKPSASVLLRLRAGRSLSDGQAQAIVHLVASSVPGLAPEGVSVVDANGRLLSAAGGADGAAAADRRIAAQARIEDRYKAQLAALLTPVVGAGAFTAEVHADLDFSETQATREGFPKEGAVIRQEQGGWTTDGGGADPAGGIPGALANQPPPASAVAAAPGGTLAPTVPGAVDGAAAAKREENYNRSFALGREVSVTKSEVGQVRRLSVAVALKNPAGKPRTPAEIAAIEALVKGAVGFDANRGDQVAVQARAFATEPVVAPAWWEAPWVAPLARHATALVVAALFVFGLGRPLLRRRAGKDAAPDGAAKSAVGGELAAALADHARADPASPVTVEMIETAPSYEARAALIRNFVRQDPARAALVVRDLLRADGEAQAHAN